MPGVGCGTATAPVLVVVLDRVGSGSDTEGWLPVAAPCRASWSTEVVCATASTRTSCMRIIDWSLPMVFLLKTAMTSTESPGEMRPPADDNSGKGTHIARLPAGTRSDSFLTVGSVLLVKR